MDTMNAVDLAQRIGASLPTVHARLDRAGVPRTGRGVERVVPAEVAERLLREHVPGFSPTALRLLAALLASPMGLGSARRIADLAGLSPTSVTKVLPGLIDLGLVQQRDRRAIHSGRVRSTQDYEVEVTSPEWAKVADAVHRMPLPMPHPEPAVGVPQSFWHLFWNATPATLRLNREGAYIARRLLTSQSAAAAQWALEHVATPDLLAAVGGRGADARTRAMVENWVAA